MDDLHDIFLKLKKIIESYSDEFLLEDHYLGSKAKNNKPASHLYSTKEVSLFGKKPQKTYIAGVIQQKNYVSFYFSPIYSHPEDFQDINPNLKKHLKGKSCFNISHLSEKLLDDIETLLEHGIEKYKDLKWI